MTNIVQLGLDFIGSRFATNDINIYDSEELNLQLTSGMPLDSQFLTSSQVMHQPAENGTNVSDHRIINPVQLRIPFYVNEQNYSTFYESLTKLFNDSTLLVVQTRIAVYVNMFIEEFPHEERADKLDGIIFLVKFMQKLYNNQVDNFAPTDPKNQDKVLVGTKYPQNVPSYANTQALALLSGFAIWGNNLLK